MKNAPFNEGTPDKIIGDILINQVDIKDRIIYLIMKRIMDIFFTILGILMLSPIFLVVAILVKMSDKNSPIFFKQIRKGKNGKEFYMYKFRSMISNAEDLKDSLKDQNEVSGPVFKIKNDPRVTTIGKFIRRTSIDELPQLVNVLKGEMSLVGPRPPLPEEVAQYSQYELQRLTVTPGLTCYWQVSGRSSVNFDEWIEMDLQYIRERSILVDSKLIIKTIFVLFGSKYAY